MQAEGIDLPRCMEPTHPVPMLHSNSVKYCILAPCSDLKLFLSTRYRAYVIKVNIQSFIHWHVFKHLLFSGNPRFIIIVLIRESQF